MQQKQYREAADKLSTSNLSTLHEALECAGQLDTSC